MNSFRYLLHTFHFINVMPFEHFSRILQARVKFWQAYFHIHLYVKNLNLLHLNSTQGDKWTLNLWLHLENVVIKMMHSFGSVSAVVSERSLAEDEGECKDTCMIPRNPSNWSQNWGISWSGLEGTFWSTISYLQKRKWIFKNK